MTAKSPGLTQILKQMHRLWSRTTGRAKWRLAVLALALKKAEKKREKLLREKGWLVPIGLGLSPTMKCELHCTGCYARSYPRDRELPLPVWDRFIGQAVDAGVFFFVVTGGEPLERPEIIDIFEKYRIDLRRVLGSFLEFTAEELQEFNDLQSMYYIETESGMQQVPVEDYQFTRRYGQDLKESDHKLRNYKGERVRQRRHRPGRAFH